MARSASGFSGGIGGLQSVCGALTGGALALGMKYGCDANMLQGTPEEINKMRSEATEQVARLAKWFEREFGSIICRELRHSHMGTDLNMGVPWQKEWAEQLGMRERCKEMVSRTARRALIMLEDPNLNIKEPV